MQQRFHVSTHPTFEKALAAKNEALVNNPNQPYQIRKRSATKFDLVVRITQSEQTQHPERITKKRRPH